MKQNGRKKSKKANVKIIVTFVILLLLLFVEASIVYIERLNTEQVEAEEIQEDTQEVETGSEKLEELPEEENIGLEEAMEDELDESEEIAHNIDYEKEEPIQEDNLDLPDKVKDKDVKEQMAELDKGKKIAYLTFDDGPSRYVTPEILDILDSYNIKATFFVLGKQAEKNPDILKRIYEEGHSIGNHTYSHNYSFIYKNVNNFLYELEKTEEVFKNILGEDFETNLIRFPGGSFGTKKAPFRSFVLEKGYNYIDWNSLNGDAEGHYIPAKKLVNRFKSTFSNQPVLVILMHDIDAKRTTVEALPAIIDFLIEKGYEFATL